jgi:hypothetical protein
MESPPRGASRPGQPMHRKVALKIIKAGMDTRQVVARFEAERRALALMGHSHNVELS